MKRKINLIIRGHIRNAFERHTLYALIKNVARIYELKIYIHTWNVIQNGLSWRYVEPINTEVTEDAVLCYFGKGNPFFDMTHLIEKIIVDDDQKIVLHGNLEGTIVGTNTPVRGYKNMFYGMLSAAEYVYNNVDKDEKVIQTRFDLLSNSRSLSFDEALGFFERDIPSGRRVEFFHEHYFDGVDNISVASVENMYFFIKHLYENLDELNIKYKDSWNQEFIAFSERDKFFPRYMIPIPIKKPNQK